MRARRHYVGGSARRVILTDARPGRAHNHDDDGEELGMPTERERERARLIAAFGEEKGSAIDALADAYAEILGQLDAAGFVLPYREVILARDGAASVQRYVRDAASGEMRVEQLSATGGALMTPYHLIFVDDRERWAHFILTPAGLTERVLH
jgi:hypothetical protein